jgi:hypothetical protein
MPGSVTQLHDLGCHEKKRERLNVALPHHMMRCQRELCEEDMVAQQEERELGGQKEKLTPTVTCDQKNVAAEVCCRSAGYPWAATAEMQPGQHRLHPGG